MMEAKRAFTGLFAVFCVAGCLALPLAGCGGGGSRDDNAPTYKLGDFVTLKVGDSLVVDSNVSGDPVRLVISEVQDGRCPEDSNCGGPSVVRVVASLSGAGAAAQTFTTADVSPPLVVAASGNRPAYSVDITGVKPALKLSSQRIAQDEFRVPVKVERVP